MAEHVSGIPVLTVFSRPGCHLCEQLIEELLPILAGRATLDVCNIDEREELTREYGTRIPVVAIDGVAICQYRLDRDAVLAAIDPDEAA